MNIPRDIIEAEIFLGLLEFKNVLISEEKMILCKIDLSR